MANQVQIGKAFVVIGGKAGPLYKTLSQVSKRMRSFGASLNAIGAQMVRTAALAAIPFGLAARTFANFSDQMSAVKAVTGATEDEFKALTETAKELGRTTSFTAQEVATGMLALSRAGFSARETISAIPGVLDLARGTATEMGEAASIVTATMKQFGLQATDTTFIVDLLTKTANSSAQTLTDLGESMGYVGSIAKASGQDIKDVAATIGVLANAGIKGSRAGTGLARVLKNMSTGQAQGVLAELGIQVADVEGNFRKVSDILAELVAKTENLGNVKKLQIFEDLFGRGAVSALSLTNEKFEEMRVKLNDISGTAKDTAAEMDNNLGGAWRRMTSAVEGVAIAIGDSLDMALRDLLKSVTDIAGKITAFVTQNKQLILGVAEMIAALGLAGAALIALGTTLTATGIALQGFMLLLSPAGLTGVAVAGVLYLVGAFDGVREAVGKLPAPIMKFLEFTATVFSAIGDVVLASMDYVYQVIVDTIAPVANRFKIVGLAAAQFLVDGLLQMGGPLIGIANFMLEVFQTAISGISKLFIGFLDTVSGVAYALDIIDDKQLVSFEKTIRGMEKSAETLVEKLPTTVTDLSTNIADSLAKALNEPVRNGADAALENLKNSGEKLKNIFIPATDAAKTELASSLEGLTDPLTGFAGQAAAAQATAAAPRISTIGSFSAREAQSANKGLSGSMNSLTGAVKKLDNTIQKTAARVPAYGA